MNVASCIKHPPLTNQSAVGVPTQTGPTQKALNSRFRVFSNISNKNSAIRLSFKQVQLNTPHKNDSSKRTNKNSTINSLNQQTSSRFTICPQPNATHQAVTLTIKFHFA